MLFLTQGQLLTKAKGATRNLKITCRRTADCCAGISTNVTVLASGADLRIHGIALHYSTTASIWIAAAARISYKLQVVQLNYR